MKDDYMKLLVAVVIIAIAGFLFYRIANAKMTTEKGYKGQSNPNAKGVGGWWQGLWDNAANIVDAGGRHTSSAVTATGNAISSIIATSKTGKYAESGYGYSDPKTDYGPYILGGALLVTAGVVAAITLSK